MAGKVGEAFVEIVADYQSFIRDAEQRLNVLLKRLAAKADFAPMTQASGEAGEDSAEEYTDSFEREVNSSAQKTRRRRTAERIGRDYSQSVRRGADGESRRRRGGLFGGGGGGDDSGGGRGRDRNVTASIFGKIGDAGKDFLSFLGSGLQTAASNALSTLGSLASGFLTLVITVGLLGPPIYVLVGALVSLSGVLFLLPAGIAAAGAAFGVLMIAFSGFGEAVSALASGDMEAFNKALKGLSPSAQKVAKEFQGVWDAFQKIKSAVQEAFFAPLVGQLSKLADKVLPKLTPALTLIAGQFGELARQFLEKLSSPAGVAFFQTALESISNILNTLSPQLLYLFNALGGLFIASLPFAEQLFGMIAVGLKRFADFIDTKVADGSFEEFLSNSLLTVEDFVDVLKNLIELFAALFVNTDEGGRNFLKDISAALAKLTAFFESPQGKEALNAMIKLAGLFGQAILWAAGQVGSIYAGLKKVVQVCKDAWAWLDRVIDKAGQVASPFIAGAIRTLKSLPFFADGGIVTRPTLGVMGEAGPEVVVPLNNPRRARELMADSGLLDIAGGIGGDGATQVVVYLGTEQITDILDQRVNRGLRQQGRRLSQGVREG